MAADGARRAVDVPPIESGRHDFVLILLGVAMCERALLLGMWMTGPSAMPKPSSTEKSPVYEPFRVATRKMSGV